MWERARECVLEVDHQRAGAPRRNGITPGQELVKEMVARRRIIARRQHAAHKLRICCKTHRLDAVVEGSVYVLAFMTCVVFGVSIVMVAHLHNPDVLTSNPWFRGVAFGALGAWAACLGCYGAAHSLEDFISSWEEDPHEVTI